ncbi:DeoR/GlpR family DNA-binding transcription regulator [Streptococcus devriesei]|uniref:DeoR/GlpR family DNA-binding transcription regulator n=1 Tax=Streptococcus devriesei TaxID=231233 RepID=UPI002480AE54|nr:DeoR/GlpR family DNA-binding transcription regulator [Streptococcus devriesei]
MLKSERKQIIMEKLSQENFVTLEFLVSILDTSESTVRRDLDELASEKKLHRVHGGAEKNHPLQEEETILQKSIKNVQAKQAIVQKAAEMISAGDVIFIDAGTTTELLLDMLQQEGLTVVTNSIHHAAKLVEKDINTLVIGGYVKNSTDASVGQFAINQLSQLNFDKAFIGMNGVDLHFLTTPDTEEAAIKKTVIDNAQTTYALVDASKMGQTSFVKVARLETVTIITNKSDSRMLKETKKKTKVIEV